MDLERIYLSTIDPQAGCVAREYGLGIEIAEFCTAWNMDVYLEQTRRTLNTALSGVSRLILHGPFNELFPCAIDPRARALARERFCQAISLARCYGAQKVVLHGGYNPWLYYPQWYIPESVSFWRDFLSEIPGDMTVCLENVLEPEPDMLLSVIQSVDDPRLRLCLDIGHCNAYSKVSVWEWLTAYAPCLSHLHIHNNSGTGDTHSPLPVGTIPVKEFLRRADSLCPGVTATLELPDCRDSVCWLMEEETWKDN